MITREAAEAICKKHGLKMAAKDDPIYSRPPTVLFVSRKRPVSIDKEATLPEEQQDK